MYVVCMGEVCKLCKLYVGKYKYWLFWCILDIDVDYIFCLFELGRYVRIDDGFLDICVCILVGDLEERS